MPTSLPSALFRRADESSDLAFLRPTPFGRAHRTRNHRRRDPALPRNVARRRRHPGHDEFVDFPSARRNGIRPRRGDRHERARTWGQPAPERLCKVHDLNADPRLPFGDAEFDAAVCCVSVQYLTRPTASLRRPRPRLPRRSAARHHLFQPLLSHQSRRRLADARRQRTPRFGRNLPRRRRRSGRTSRNSTAPRPARRNRSWQLWPAAPDPK